MNIRHMPARLFMALCFGLIVVGCGLVAYWPETWWPHHKAAEAVGHALIIAGVLALCVDWFVKDRLLHEISKDTAKYLIGYGLPPEIQLRIRDLMAASVVRTGFVLRYKLMVSADGADILEVNLEYVIHNAGGHGEPFTPSIVADEKEQPHFLEMSFVGPKPFYLDEAELQKRATHKQGQVSVRGDTVTLQPSVAAATYTYRQRYLIRPQDSHDVFVFGKPTVDVKVVFDVPTGYVVENQSMSQAAEGPSNEWHYDHAFLPGEHLNYRWFKEGRSA